MKTRRIPLAIAITAALLGSTPTAFSAVLGEVVALSALGEAFSAEIRLARADGTPRADCFRVVTPGDAGNDLPALTRGRVSVVGGAAGARLLVRDSRAVHDPIVRLAIENVCDARLRREYTLLMPFTATASAPAPAGARAADRSAAPPPRRASAPAPAPARPKAASRTWTTAPGESLTSLGEALYPDDEAARARFTSATAAANPRLFPDTSAHGRALPAGTRVVIPDLRRVAANTANAAPAGGAQARGQAVAPATGEDRLVVERATVPAPDARQAGGDTGAAAEAADSLSAREREVAAAIDRSIIAEMELLARIKELEDLQARLEARVRSMAPPPPAAAVVTAAASPPPAPTAVQAPAPAAVSHDLYLFAGLGAAALLLAALLLRRRRDPERVHRSPAEHPQRNAALPVRDPERSPAAPGVAQALPQGQGAVDTVTDPRLAEGTVVEEHKSAVELADIMMSFGRVQGAAETLAEFIRGNPREAVTPWLKLLEVYRAAGLRAEFDAIAGELNKTFNVSKVNWDNYQSLRDSRMSLEDLPHISETLQRSWRTTACQRYLQQLLRDNRDGTRFGFPFTVIDEVLTLSAILEEDLGPCPKPDQGRSARG